MSGKKACLFPLVDFSNPPVEQDRRQSLTDALGGELQAAGLELIDPEQWRQAEQTLSLAPADLLSGPAAVSLARGAGADIAVSGFFSLSGDRLQLCLSCYDVSDGDMVAGFTRSWRFNLGFYNSLHSQMGDLLPRLALARKPASEEDSPATVLLSELVFTSPLEGMEVLLGGETEVGRIEAGKLVLNAEGIRPGAPFVIEKEKEGYHTSWQTVDAAPVVPLTPLAKKTTLAFELDWTLGQLLGVGVSARQYFIPDSLFMGLSLYPYLQAPPAKAGKPALHFDFNMVLGGYLFFPPDSPFRLGVSAGAGTIFTTVLTPGIPPYTDFYLDVASIWAELNLTGVSIFLRFEAKYALGVGNDLLGSDFIRWEFFPPVTLGVLIK